LCIAFSSLFKKLLEDEQKCVEQVMMESDWNHIAMPNPNLQLFFIKKNTCWSVMGVVGSGDLVEDHMEIDPYSLAAKFAVSFPCTQL
jgi:hypothetical protein